MDRGARCPCVLVLAPALAVLLDGVPPPAFTRALTVRALLVWTVMRSFAVVGRRMTAVPGGQSGLAEVMVLPFPALVWLYAFVLAAVLLDARARREDRFLANVGVSKLGMAGVVVGTVTALEAATFLGVWLLAG